MNIVIDTYFMRSFMVKISIIPCKYDVNILHMRYFTKQLIKVIYKVQFLPTMHILPCIINYFIDLITLKPSSIKLFEVVYCFYKDNSNVQSNSSITKTNYNKHLIKTHL